MNKNTIGLCTKCREVTGVHPYADNRSICNDCDRTATIHYHNRDGSTRISLSDKPDAPLWFEGGHYDQALNDALQALTIDGYNFDDQTDFEVVAGVF